MFLLKKVLPAFLLLLLLIFEDALCQTDSVVRPYRIEGRTMGTTYSVLYFDDVARDFNYSIDSLLRQVNRAISNYDPASDVSIFNKSLSGSQKQSYHFTSALQKSMEVALASAGNFDPTVMPLVNLWGFGPNKNLEPSTAKMDSIKKFVGYNHVRLAEAQADKDHPYVQIDFGGIGQGYGVDVISDFLRDKGIKNFLVELGGEGYAAGKNIHTNTSWRIGIIDPFSSKDEQVLLGYVVIEDKSFTTSGNYFNYRIIDGKKYGHTISPFTGFPVQQDLISVSIFANDCATADGWATAFMVAGKEKAINFLAKNSHLAAILISVDGGKQDIFISESIRDKVFLEQAHDH